VDAAVLEEIGEVIGASDAVGPTDEGVLVELAAMDAAVSGEVGEVIGASDAVGSMDETC